jgi:thioredoxin reductase (NADPH)
MRLPEPGGQVTAMYPEKMIYRRPGFPADPRPRPGDEPRRAGGPVHPDYRLGVRADTLEYLDGKPLLGLADGSQLHCGSIIITVGWAASAPVRCRARPSSPATGVCYFVPHLADLTGHKRRHRRRWRLGVRLGARAAAAGQVGDARAPPGQVPGARLHGDRVQALPVEIIVNAQLNRHHRRGQGDGVEVSVRGERRPRVLPADTVVAALASIADLGPWRVGLELRKRHIRVVSTPRPTCRGCSRGHLGVTPARCG